MNKNEMRALYGAADVAGKAAAAARVPAPMTVYEADLNGAPLPGGKVYGPYADGACGFAWVNVRPGNSRFANWLKSEGLAHRDSYAGGVSIWVSAYNQSWERKAAYAGAFAAVLRDAGLNAYADDRLD